MSYRCIPPLTGCTKMNSGYNKTLNGKMQNRKTIYKNIFITLGKKRFLFSIKMYFSIVVISVV